MGIPEKERLQKSSFILYCIKIGIITIAFHLFKFNYKVKVHIIEVRVYTDDNVTKTLSEKIRYQVKVSRDMCGELRQLYRVY